MRDIPTKEIEAFAAGAFALWGLRALASIPVIISRSMPAEALAITLSSEALLSLALPLGLGILAGSARALRWTKVMLWLTLVTSVLGVLVLSQLRGARVTTGEVTDVLVCVVLIYLFSAKRFRQPVA